MAMASYNKQLCEYTAEINKIVNTNLEDLDGKQTKFFLVEINLLYEKLEDEGLLTKKVLADGSF